MYPKMVVGDGADNFCQPSACHAKPLSNSFVRRQLTTGQIDRCSLMFLELNEKRLKDKEPIIHQVEKPKSPPVKGRFIDCHRQVGSWKNCLLDNVSPVPFIRHHEVRQFMMNLFALLTSQPSDNKTTGFSTFISQLSLS